MSRPVSSDQVSEYLSLVYFHANRYRVKTPASVCYEDLVAAGKLGLVQALTKRASGQEVNEAYVSIRVNGAIVDCLRKADYATGRRTRPAEAVHVELMPGEDLAKLASSATMDADLECIDFAKKALGVLPERELKIIRWLFLEDIQANEVALRLGVSEARVAQIKARAIRRMRDFYEQNVTADRSVA